MKFSPPNFPYSPPGPSIHVSHTYIEYINYILSAHDTALFIIELYITIYVYYIERKRDITHCDDLLHFVCMSLSDIGLINKNPLSGPKYNLIYNPNIFS